MKELTVRGITGFVFVALIIGSVLIHPLAFAFVFLLFTLLAMREFYRLIPVRPTPGRLAWAMATGGFVFLLCFLQRWANLPLMYFLVLVPLVLGMFLSELYARTEEPAGDLAFSLLGIIYVPLPFAFLNFLLMPEPGVYLPEIFLGFFALLWTSDTAAYFVGITVGRHRLFERVSPKKSWEGFFGGLLATLIVAWFLGQYIDIFPMYHWFIIALLIVGFGVFGDLFESLIKRGAGTKDSGSFLPGHGGVLDRFDSVLFAAPCVYVYLQFFVFNI